VKDRQRDVLVLNKSVVEGRIARRVSVTANEALEALHSTVVRIGRLIHQREHVQRQYPTTSVADPQGNKVVYCEPVEIEAHIQRVSISGLELRHRSPACRAHFMPQVTGCCRARLVNRARSRFVAGRLLPCCVHAASRDRRHRLSE